MNEPNADLIRTLGGYFLVSRQVDVQPKGECFTKLVYTFMCIDFRLLHAWFPKFFLHKHPHFEVPSTARPYKWHRESPDLTTTS